MAASRPKRAQVAERRRQAIELRAAGKSWDDIAHTLGYNSRGAACQDFGRALKIRLKEQDDAVDHLRALELERLDEMQRQAWDVLHKPHVLVQGGKPVTVTAEGRSITLQDDGPKLAAIASLLRIGERRARLLGLDSPERVEATTTVRYTIDGVDMGKLS